MRLTSSLLTVVTMVAGASIAAGQTEITVVAPAPQVDSLRLHVTSVATVGTFNKTDVLNHIWSFDLNEDNRISGDELPERMHALILKVDGNSDGVLSSEELIEAVRHASLERIKLSSSVRTKVVTLEDVVSDLRLPQAKHDLALDLVKNISD